jgi:hypothetical protein
MSTEKREPQMMVNWEEKKAFCETCGYWVDADVITINWHHPIPGGGESKHRLWDRPGRPTHIAANDYVGAAGAQQQLLFLRSDLEEMGDGGPAIEVVEKILMDPYEAARAALRIAILLGAAENWDGGADYLEGIADELGDASMFAHPGDDDNKALYRFLAEGLGMDYPGRDEERETE